MTFIYIFIVTIFFYPWLVHGVPLHRRACGLACVIYVYVNPSSDPSSMYLVNVYLARINLWESRNLPLCILLGYHFINTYRKR